jgi:ubiquitin-activating enzyme E1 C
MLCVDPLLVCAQEFDRDWYSQFNIVIAGLDNQAAREWLNNTVLDLVRYDEDGNVDEDTVVPMIDGGTEGLAGQVRIFVPRKNSCFTCQQASAVARADTHMCTPAVNPRIPEHCIQYALIFLWPLIAELDPKSAAKFKLWEGKADENPTPVKLDKDDPVHMTWLFNRGLEWAEKHNIKGVTYSLCMQVVKNIIPAVACTNAIMAAACINEALKWTTQAAPTIDNYLTYQGNSALGTYSRTFRYHRNPDCDACKVPVMVTLPASATLQTLFDTLNSKRKADEQKNARKQPKVVSRGDSKVYSVVTSAKSELEKPLSAFLKPDEETGGYQRDLWRISDADGNITQVHITAT